jgi:hypothetical protein
MYADLTGILYLLTSGFTDTYSQKRFVVTSPSPVYSAVTRIKYSLYVSLELSFFIHVLLNETMRHKIKHQLQKYTQNSIHIY